MGFFIPHEQAAVVKYLALGEPKGYMGTAPHDDYLNRAMSSAMGTFQPSRTAREVTSDLYQPRIKKEASLGLYNASTCYNCGQGYVSE